MPPLDNPKHEAFAQFLAKGNKATQAYALAGYTKSPAAASRLLKDVNIVRRMKELQHAVSEISTIDSVRVVQELARVGLSDLGHFMNRDGSMKPVSEWTTDMTAAISSLEFETLPAKGRRKERTVVKKLRLWPKGEALNLIAKHLGMLVERSEQNVTHSYADMPEEEVNYEISAILEEVRKLNPGKKAH